MSISDATASRLEIAGSRLPSLTDLCRDVLVQHLERYPAPAFGILDGAEWYVVSIPHGSRFECFPYFSAIAIIGIFLVSYRESLIKLRHEKTKPRTGQRIAPAVTDKFLKAVEASVPRFAESRVTDNLVWQACVNHRFRVGGGSQVRPRELLYPWPLLVSRLQSAANGLLDIVRKSGPLGADDRPKYRSKATEAIDVLSSSPMNVRLLEATGVGKSVKKVLKLLSSRDEDFLGLNRSPPCNQPMPSPKQKLESALQSWKKIAAQSGVKMRHDAILYPDSDGKVDDQKLQQAEACQTWRQLFETLKQNDERFRENQGAKMRERKERLNKVRPKIVKVRPANSRHDAVLSKSPQRWGTTPNAVKQPSGNSRIRQLRMEAGVTSLRRSAPEKPKVVAGGRVRGGFGDAVAFASGGTNNSAKRKSTTLVPLGHGKRMKVPDAKRAGQDLKKRLGLLTKSKSPSRR